MSQRHEITCPHCRRSYALRIAPENLEDASARVRCGRCRKRFRLSAAVAASADRPPESKERANYRKRISRPAMRRVSLDDEEPQRPGDMVDDMARAFERALRERRRSREEGLTATEAEIPLEDDRSDIKTETIARAAEARVTPAERTPEELSTPPARQRKKTPRVFRFTPPPVAREIIFGGAGRFLGPDDPAFHPERPADEPDTPDPDEVVIDPPPDERAYGEMRRRGRSSHPPRPNARSSAPPPLPEGANIASRQAWLDFADESLEGLTALRTQSVTALEWLLGEDTLGEA